ncbi:hypothetical protein [Sphingomonas sp.]|uniref:hypothetical protein n=1 Tax=Sphingomonas sp. TaxID=28214 RepID=UPI0025DDE342|nr:hypothetical protein [Sphingomonas sp.]
MKIDRAELAGTGAALAFHAALIAALSLSLAHVAQYSEPPPMEVELVDEVGLTPSAPSPLAVPPPPSQAPQQAVAPSPEVAPTPPTPTVTPLPAPRVTPTLPRPVADRPAPARSAPAKAQPKVSRIGADFLKGIADAPATASQTKPAAVVFDAVAKTSVSAAIARQIQPCASRQPFIGEGANRIQLSLNLRLDRSGRLTQPPTLVGSPSGIDDDNSRYVDVVKDQARRVYADCSPLRLPAELYQTPSGGWGNITIKYKVK